MKDDKDTDVVNALKRIRNRIINHLLPDEKNAFPDNDNLPLPPRNLAEAIKAIIDLDRHIAEQEGERPIGSLDPYYQILRQCAASTEDQPVES